MTYEPLTDAEIEEYGHEAGYFPNPAQTYIRRLLATVDALKARANADYDSMLEAAGHSKFSSEPVQCAILRLREERDALKARVERMEKVLGAMERVASHPTVMNAMDNVPLDWGRKERIAIKLPPIGPPT